MTIDPHTLKLLEFDKVLPELRDHADSAWGRELSMALAPQTDVESARHEHARLREWASLEDADPRPPGLALDDLRPLLDALDEGVVLEPGDLLEVARAIALAIELAAVVDRSETVPILRDEAAGLGRFPDLARAIHAAIDERGEVRDSASSELGRLRRAVRASEKRLTDRLERLAQSIGAQSVVTRRRDRLTISVPTESLRKVKGLVHDRSQSGASVFVEPLEVVELQNQLEDDTAAERREVLRILGELSRIVGECRVELRDTGLIVAAFDALRARARLWRDWQGTLPDLGVGGPIRLLSGRHPLLDRVLRSAGGALVPLTIELDGSRRVVVVTGPNMGGKTVALKTLGLLTLLAMAGLPVPAAEGTRLGFFEHIVADIGDEQSIEQNLSTFASHLRRIRDSVQLAGPDTLVLLDELGAGTDPSEGGALGQAVLEHLTAGKALCVVTTHHGELKTLAVRHPAVVNASMSFDPETHASRFELITGVPGRSFALDVAARLGMPPAVLDRAATLVSRDEARLQELIVDLDRQRQGAVTDRERLEAERSELAAERAHYESKLERILETRDRIQSQAHAEADAFLDEAREVVREARRFVRESHARAAAPSAGPRETDRPAAGQEIEAIAERVRALRERPKPAPSRRQEPAAGGGRGALAPTMPMPIDPEALEPGQRVIAPRLGEVEVVERPSSAGRVRVRRGPMTLEVDVATLEGAVGAPSPAAGTTESRAPSYTIEDSAPPPLELDLRGMLGDEASAAVERYIDQAVLHDLPSVRIIHGKGTGELRRRVEALLAGHPHIADARLAELNQGGAGVTVVAIRR